MQLYKSGKIKKQENIFVNCTTSMYICFVWNDDHYIRFIYLHFVMLFFFIELFYVWPVLNITKFRY